MIITRRAIHIPVGQPYTRSIIMVFEPMLQEAIRICLLLRVIFAIDLPWSSSSKITRDWETKIP